MTGARARLRRNGHPAGPASRGAVPSGWTGEATGYRAPPTQPPPAGPAPVPAACGSAAMARGLGRGPWIAASSGTEVLRGSAAKAGRRARAGAGAAGSPFVAGPGMGSGSGDGAAEAIGAGAASGCGVAMMLATSAGSGSGSGMIGTGSNSGGRKCDVAKCPQIAGRSHPCDFTLHGPAAPRLVWKVYSPRSHSTMR